MAGTLSIVATPIGHLEDITLRALNVLRAVDLIAAEDTRHTGRLLAHYGISTPTVSFHEHNTRSRLPGLIRQLKAGQTVALVSDAGTPLLSDPGLELVQGCVREGIPVDAIPGPSAPLALAVLSGFPMFPWTVFGFPPTRSKDRKQWLAAVASTTHSLTFLEAPHRILLTLEHLAQTSVDRPIIVGRELTKIHQTLYRGTIGSVISAGIERRGEFTVMLGPVMQPRSAHPRPTDRQLAHEFGETTKITGGTRRTNLKDLADRHGLPIREVYAAIERAKSKT